MEGALASWPAELGAQPGSSRSGGCLAGGAAAHPGLPERMHGPLGAGGDVPAQVHAPAHPPAVALPLHTAARPVIPIAWPPPPTELAAVRSTADMELRPHRYGNRVHDMQHCILQPAMSRISLHIHLTILYQSNRLPLMQLSCGVSYLECYELAGLLPDLGSCPECIAGAEDHCPAVNLLPGLDTQRADFPGCVRPPAAQQQLCAGEGILIQLDHPVPECAQLHTVLPELGLQARQPQSLQHQSRNRRACCNMLYDWNKLMKRRFGLVNILTSYEVPMLNVGLRGWDSS